MHSHNCLDDISNFIFEHNNLSRLLLLALADAVPYKKPCNITFQIYFLAYTSLFSVKSNVLKLGTAKKVYSVNKGLFLGVFLTMVRIRGWYHDAIYHPLC